MDPASLIARYALRVYNLGLTTTSGGNISILEDGFMWITPKGTDKGSLSHDIMAKASFRDGHAIEWEGVHKPSTEWPFHEAIYAVRNDIKAIIHSHPPFLQAFAIGHGVPDTSLLSTARNLCGKAEFSRYRLPGSRELGDELATCFKKGASCVIMENHGVVIGGKDIADAFSKLEELEHCCRIQARAVCLGAAKRLENGQIRVSIVPKGGKGGSDENHKKLCDFAGRAYHHKLFTTAAGVLSVRDGEGFWILHPDADPSDCVDQVSWVPLDADTQPSNCLDLVATHQAIYKQHINVDAIVSAHPINTSAMGIVPTAPLKFHSTPEGFLVVGNVEGINLDDIQTAETVASIINPGNSVNTVLVRGDMVHVTGESLLKCFDRLEVLESVATSTIDAGLMDHAGILTRGKPDQVLMTPEQIEEFNTQWIGFK